MGKVKKLKVTDAVEKKTKKPEPFIAFSKPPVGATGVKKSLKKKDKLKRKYKDFQKKIDLIKTEKKEEIARKKREKTVITGDLRPLKDSLPSLDELLKIKPNEIKTGIPDFDNPEKVKVSKKELLKKKKEEFMNRYNHLEKLITCEEFKINPREAIAAHIRARYRME